MQVRPKVIFVTMLIIGQSRASDVQLYLFNAFNYILIPYNVMRLYILHMQSNEVNECTKRKGKALNTAYSSLNATMWPSKPGMSGYKGF